MINIFIRNDDVRGVLDNSLIEITNICVNNSVPICHAVEPANVSMEVVDWLLEMKMKYPQLISIIQHGYDHKIKYQLTRFGKLIQGEFGGNRNIDEQYNDLRKGYNLMVDYFGDRWCPIISIPYGIFNNNTLRAIDRIGYQGFTTSVSYSPKHRIKDKIGNFLNINFILYRQISYHMCKRSGFSFTDIGVSVNIIKKYLNEKEAIHYTNEEIKKNILFNSKFTENVGILLHHRYHNEVTNQITDLITSLKETNNYSFVSIEDLIC
jgi:hypothetical protein